MIRKLTYLICLLTVISCKKPYKPAAITQSAGFLVVEGVINTGNDSTFIKLSRTTALSDPSKLVAENGATLYVEDNNGKTYNLRQTVPGTYVAPPLNFQGAAKCRLHIATNDQKAYTSDFVSIDVTPAIDSVTYSIVGNGLQIYAYAHDPTNNVRYFRWSFDETWEYTSHFYSYLKYENGQILPRTDDIYHCWISAPATNIVLAATTQLSQSVINKQPITFVAETTGKLVLGYSILVKQYALTADAYNYWQQLKKNNESLGTVFDSQPTNLTGNIHNTNDTAEPVLGYISASNVTTKRFIIGHNSIVLYTPGYYGPPSAGACDSVNHKIDLSPANSFDVRAKAVFFSGDSIPIIDYGFNGVKLGYNYAPKECVDCRAKALNGTNVRPPYWPVNL